MRFVFSDNAWEDYTSWLTEDKKNLKKINDLIKGFYGITIFDGFAQILYLYKKTAV